MLGLLSEDDPRRLVWACRLHLSRLVGLGQGHLDLGAAQPIEAVAATATTKPRNVVAGWWSWCSSERRPHRYSLGFFLMRWRLVGLLRTRCKYAGSAARNKATTSELAGQPEQHEAEQMRRSSSPGRGPSRRTAAQSPLPALRR